MRVFGMAAEYNPFHLGHALHLAESRRLLGEDAAAVCVMSGCFTQRGDLAVFGKYARAEAAVRCGADLVLELPLSSALSSAEGFAAGAVGVLEAMGNVGYMSFGSESGDVKSLETAADALLLPETEERIRDALAKGLSYPAAVERAAGTDRELVSEPNNILALEYLKALRRTGSKIQPVTVKRSGAGHDSPETGETASASKIRELLLEGSEEAWKYIPLRAAEVFRREMSLGRGPVSIQGAETAILSYLRRMSGEELCEADGGGEGVGFRLKKALAEPTLQLAAEAAKTKRYPMSRIRRLMLRAWLGLPAREETPGFAKALAMSRRGAEIIKTSKLRILTKPSALDGLTDIQRAAAERDALASDLYALALPVAAARRGGSEYRSVPFVLKQTQEDPCTADICVFK